MSQKHLHELLREDQEPFILKNYIAERRCRLNKPSPSLTQNQIGRPKPESSNLVGNFCKNACLFSSHDSPDLKNSPLVVRHSPVKSPTLKAAILLDAAIRIHKQTLSPTTKTRFKNRSFGLFGSFLKRFSTRNGTQNREIREEDDKVSVRDILKWDPPLGHAKSPTVSSETGFSNERSSGGFWSESNEEISLDLETSCSSHFDDSEGFEFSSRLRDDFCESSFRFVLQNSLSSASRTPELSLPATSPSLHKEKDNLSYDVESLNNLRVQEVEEDEEQTSPVSVFDPPFEDDEREDDGCDLKCRYAIVESMLSRFEKLAELDPVELEKRMEEEEEADDDYDDKTDWFDEEEGNSDMSISLQFSKDMKRLISDVIAEEERDESVYKNTDEVVKRVTKRLESWEEVKTNTIDKMVEQDLKMERDRGKINEEEMREAAIDVELAIFEFLVDELASELDSRTFQ